MFPLSVTALAAQYARSHSVCTDFALELKGKPDSSFTKVSSYTYDNNIKRPWGEPKGQGYRTLKFKLGIWICVKEAEPEQILILSICE